jgi:hypothetical protein
MTGKCVKGYIVASGVERVREALDQGRIGRDQVEVILGDWAGLLDEKIDPFRWYPVKALEGLNRLLAKAKGGSQRSAMLALGEAQFEELAALGVHQQLTFLEGELSQASPEEIGRWGRLVSTLIRSVYNFSEMSFEADPALPGRYNLDWRSIGDLGDEVLEATLGFIAALARRASGPAARLTLERPAPGHARYVFEPAGVLVERMERESPR